MYTWNFLFVSQITGFFFLPIRCFRQNCAVAVVLTFIFPHPPVVPTFIQHALLTYYNLFAIVIYLLLGS